jgi:hypothetical protein
MRAAKPVDSQPPFFGQPAANGIVSSSIRGLVTIKPMLDNGSGSEASVPAQQASVNAVIDMLSSWQKAQHVAP